MRRTHPLPAAMAAFVLTCFATMPAPATAAAAGAAPVELVRPGDQAMSCQALAAEINQLAAADQAPAAGEGQPAKPKKHGGLLRALGHAAPFLGPVGMLGSGVTAMVASTAVSAASTAGASHQRDDMMDQSRQAMNRALDGPSVESQRRERLSGIFDAKHC